MFVLRIKIDFRDPDQLISTVSKRRFAFYWFFQLATQLNEIRFNKENCQTNFRVQI